MNSSTVTSAYRLDETDLRILGCLQDEASLDNRELARRVHLSPAPCLRRVRRLIVIVRACVIVFVLVDAELRGGDPRAQHARGVDVRVAERQAAERALQIVERQAGVEQRAERHVARDPRKAVEVKNPAHGCLVSLMLQYRASPRMR